MIMKVAKATLTDVHMTAVWSPPVSVVNSVAEERIPRLRKKECSIKFRDTVFIDASKVN